MIVRTLAICLRIVPYSETSRIVTWLTPGHGKILTLVKGAQRPKSLFLGQFDLFYTCELLFYLRGDRGLQIARECTPLNPRAAFRSRWRSTGCASYFADLGARIGPFHAPHPELFAWMGQTLDFFAGADRIGACFHWFELKVLEVMGMAPQFQVCIQCHQPVTAGWFAYGEGGVRCARCPSARAAPGVALAPDVLGLLRYWQQAPTWQAALNTRCTPRQLQDIERLLGLFLEYHLGLPLAGRSIALELLR